MAAASDSSDGDLDLKTIVLNDLDGGRGSGLPRKARSKHTITESQSPKNVTQSRSAECLSPRPPYNYATTHGPPLSYHPSLENLKTKTSTLNISSSSSSGNNSGRSVRTTCSSIPEGAAGGGVPKKSEDLDETYDFDDDEDGVATSTSSDDELEQASSQVSRDTKRSAGARSNSISRSSRNTGRKKLQAVIDNDDQRAAMISNVACSFAFKAMRRYKRENEAMQEQLQKKKEEVAARVILHNLLVNSWRLKSSELAVYTQENLQLHKTIDNLCLQLRVVRHLQSSEKEKAAGRNNEFEHLTKELMDVKESSNRVQQELNKVKEEKDSLLSGLRELSDEHESISKQYEELLDQKNSILRCNNKNKMRADHLKRENETLVRDLELHRDQIQQLTKQSEHWQEKALAFESDCWEQRLSIESAEKKFREAEKERCRLQKEVNILALSKSKAEAAVHETEEKLQSSEDEKNKLVEKLTKCEIHLNAMTDQVSNLSCILNQLKKENSDLKKNLMEVSLENVRKRRAWGSALYYVFSPIEALKTLLYGSSSAARTNNNHPRSSSN